MQSRSDLQTLLSSHMPRYSSVDGPVCACACGHPLELGESWTDHFVDDVSADSQVSRALATVVQQLRLRGEQRAAEIVRAIWTHPRLLR